MQEFYFFGGNENLGKTYSVQLSLSHKIKKTKFP